ncbi:FluC/FEX family fluoride channel [Micromonospora sp. SH-82]|uniref:FluC/FEX family fluoride channel n=1 Tax=Micromonospora sp. SH-82 TaxID=3132938 RepID=UPI003EB7DBF2
MSEPSPSPVDPDVDLTVTAERVELHPSPIPVLAAVSVGGMLGAAARHGLGVAWPHTPAEFPWATLVVNVSGCLLIGVLMAVVTRVGSGRLLRPFLGVGVLGGYTTFSTYVVDIQQAVAAGRAGVGLLYLAATLVAALAAVWAGVGVTGRLIRRRTARRRGGQENR